MQNGQTNIDNTCSIEAQNKLRVVNDPTQALVKVQLRTPRTTTNNVAIAIASKLISLLPLLVGSFDVTPMTVVG